MKVLIVAKTRQGCGACIGGITLEEGRSVRLIAADAVLSEHAGLEYEIGEVWEVDAAPAEQVIPPHVENIIVRAKRRLGPMSDPVPFIETHMPPLTCSASLLYAGLAQVARSGALYIAERTGIPPFSTTFWRPDQPLQRTDESKRIRYRYPTPDGGCTLTFVGFQEPSETIPVGALVRVSLAHWWQPDDDHTGELRCYVQLSGWFLPKPAARNAPRSKQPAENNRAQVEPPFSGPADGCVSFSGRVIARSGVCDEAILDIAGDCFAKTARNDGLPQDRNAPLADRTAGELTATPGLPEARGLLRSVFGYDDFRPLQAGIIANILARRDTLAVMPTGSGKSACYQTQY